MCSLLYPVISRLRPLFFLCCTWPPHSKSIPSPLHLCWSPSTIYALYKDSHFHPPCLGLMTHVFPSLSVRPVLPSASSSLSSTASVSYPPNLCIFIFLPHAQAFYSQPSLTSCPLLTTSLQTSLHKPQFSWLCNKDRFWCSAKKTVDTMSWHKGCISSEFQILKSLSALILL